MLQAIFEYQTMIARLTGLEVSNAGLYDGATALAEGVLMALSLQPGKRRVVISKGVNPQYLQVLRTHLRAQDIEYIEVELQEGATCAASWRKALGAAEDSSGAPEDSPGAAKDKGAASPGAAAAKGLCAAAVFQSPNFFGCLEDGAELTAQAHAAGALAIQVFNPISLGLLAPPGQWGVDIAAGEGQPLGMPPSAGGETLGLFAARMNHIWKMPGRLAGLTRDRLGRRSYVLTLQSREQHIRRARATSNICTNQSLYALTALIYLAALGAEGLRELAEICARRCALAREKLAALPGFGLEFPQAPVFHEFVLRTPRPAEDLFKQLHDQHGILPGFPLSREFPEMKNALLICATEMTSAADIDRLAGALAEAAT